MVEPVFYISVPQGDRTGGPECMHQLADAIIRRGYRAVLVPMWNFKGRRPDSEYADYRYEVSETVSDPDNGILVVGEVSPIESFREIRLFPKDRTWLWWLSVHNNPDPRARYFRGDSSCCQTRDPKTRGPLDSPSPSPAPSSPVHSTPFAEATISGLGREAWQRTIAPYSPGRNPRTFFTEYVSLLYNRHFIESGVGFLAQSVYAQGFCRSILGRTALPMTDYLRRPTIASSPLNPNLVLYNGAKGYTMIPRLARLLPDVDFLPIQGMSYLEVCDALQSAAAYVELGVPPGRDRLPREAAHFGTPSVLLCRGSAYCWDDFPLPDKYRVPFVEDWPRLMAPVVRDVLLDREGARSDQASFREWVAGDRDRFETEVDRWLEACLSSF